MKKLLFLFALIISSCSSFKSGLTIPANETFILGESNSKNYSAELVNTSNYEIKIRGEKKQNGEYTQRFGLAPKGKATVYVSSDEIIKFINNNNQAVKVNIKLNKAVPGMRYVKNWVVRDFSNSNWKQLSQPNSQLGIQIDGGTVCNKLGWFVSFVVIRKNINDLLIVNLFYWKYFSVILLITFTSNCGFIN